MPKPELHKRTWLNPSKGSDSYVIIHAGKHDMEFILADCSRSVSIHSYSDDTKAHRKFLRKLLKIRTNLDMLIEHVELRTSNSS